LISRERWPQERQDVCRLLQLPENGAARLKQRRAELEEELARLDRDWPQNAFVRIEAGRLVLTPLSAEDPPERSVALQEKVARHLPRVDLADLLVEVDGWTGFTRHFEHAGGREPRTKDLLVHLHAAVLAQACNLAREQQWNRKWNRAGARRLLHDVLLGDAGSPIGPRCLVLLRRPARHGHFRVFLPLLSASWIRPSKAVSIAFSPG